MDRKLEIFNKLSREMLYDRLRYLEERNNNEELSLRFCYIGSDFIKKELLEMITVNSRIILSKQEIKNISTDDRRQSKDKISSSAKSQSKGPVSRNISSKKLSPSITTSETSNKTFKTDNDARSKSKGRTLLKNNTVANSNILYCIIHFSYYHWRISKESCE